MTKTYSQVKLIIVVNNNYCTYPSSESWKRDFS